MVEIHNNTASQASPFVRSRANHCSAIKVSSGEYRVVPMTRNYRQHLGKTKRRVRFVLMGEKVFGLCLDWYDGSKCKGNEFGLPCCHLVAALNGFTKNVEAQQ